MEDTKASSSHQSALAKHNSTIFHDDSDDGEEVEENIGSPIASMLFSFLTEPSSSRYAMAWSVFTCVLVLARMLAIGLQSVNGPNQYYHRPEDLSPYPFLLTEPSYWKLYIATMTPLIIDGCARIVFLMLISFESENHPIWLRFKVDLLEVFLFITDIIGLIPFFVMAAYYHPKDLTPSRVPDVILNVLELMLNGRIFRAVKKVPAVRAIAIALSNAAPHLALPTFFFFVFNITTGVFFYFASPCYNIETCPWISLFDSTFFSIVTMTTTGYGNQVPPYELSRFLACLVMLFGALFLSMPLAIIGNEYDRAWTAVINERDAHLLSSSAHHNNAVEEEEEEEHEVTAEDDKKPGDDVLPFKQQQQQQEEEEDSVPVLTFEQKKQQLQSEPSILAINHIHNHLKHLHSDYNHHRHHITHSTILALCEMKAWLPSLSMGIEQTLALITTLSSGAFRESILQQANGGSSSQQQQQQSVFSHANHSNNQSGNNNSGRRLSVFGGRGVISIAAPNNNRLQQQQQQQQQHVSISYPRRGSVFGASGMAARPTTFLLPQQQQQPRRSLIAVAPAPPAASFVDAGGAVAPVAISIHNDLGIRRATMKKMLSAIIDNDDEDDKDSSDDSHSTKDSGKHDENTNVNRRSKEKLVEKIDEDDSHYLSSDSDDHRSGDYDEDSDDYELSTDSDDDDDNNNNANINVNNKSKNGVNSKDNNNINTDGIVVKDTINEIPEEKSNLDKHNNQLIGSSNNNNDNKFENLRPVEEVEVAAAPLAGAALSSTLPSSTTSNNETNKSKRGRTSIYIQLLSVIGVEDVAARNRTVTEDFVERMEKVSADPTSYRSRLWILLELPSSSREARLLQGVLIILISLSIFTLYTQTATDLTHYGESTAICGRLLSIYCSDKRDARLDPGCFVYNKNGTNSNITLQFNCDHDDCFGHGLNFGVTLPILVNHTEYNSNTTVFPLSCTRGSIAPFQDQEQLFDKYGQPTLFFSRLKMHRSNPICSRIECIDNSGNYEPGASDYWIVSEFFINSFFTIELILRLFVADSLLIYWKDKMNVFDMLAILPFYAELFSASISKAGFKSIDFSILSSSPDPLFLVYVRSLKVFRMFKLTRHFRVSKVLLETARRIWRQILGMLMLLSFLVFLFAIIMFVLERGRACYVGDNNCPVPEEDLPGLRIGEIVYLTKGNKLSVIPNVFFGVWFSFVTITTTGYGDIVPVTDAGQLVAIFLMIAGQFYMAMPLTAAATTFYTIHEQYTEDNNHVQEVVAAANNNKDNDDQQQKKQEEEDANNAAHQLLQQQIQVVDSRLQLSIRHILNQLQQHEKTLTTIVGDIQSSPFSLFDIDHLSALAKESKEKQQQGDDNKQSPLKLVGHLRKRIAMLCKNLEDCLQGGERDIVEVLFKYHQLLRGHSS